MFRRVVRCGESVLHPSRTRSKYVPVARRWHPNAMDGGSAENAGAIFGHAIDGPGWVEHRLAASCELPDRQTRLKELSTNARPGAQRYGCLAVLLGCLNAGDKTAVVLVQERFCRQHKPHPSAVGVHLGWTVDALDGHRQAPRDGFTACPDGVCANGACTAAKPAPRKLGEKD